MLYIAIVTHSPESCPAREENAAIHPCLNTMSELLTARGVKMVGRWADPPAHVNYMVLDAPDAHVIQAVLMESGLFLHTTTELRPVLPME